MKDLMTLSREIKKDQILQHMNNEITKSDERIDFLPIFQPQEECKMLIQKFKDQNLIESNKIFNFITVFDLNLLKTLINFDSFTPIDNFQVFINEIFKMFPSDQDQYDSIMLDIILGLLSHEKEIPSIYDVLIPFCKQLHNNCYVAQIFCSIINSLGNNHPEIDISQFWVDVFQFPIKQMIKGAQIIRFMKLESPEIHSFLLNYFINSNEWVDELEAPEFFLQLNPSREQIQILFPVLFHFLQSHNSYKISSALHIMNILLSYQINIPNEFIPLITSIFKEGSFSEKEATFLFFKLLSEDGESTLLTFFIEQGLIECLIDNFSSDDADTHSNNFLILKIIFNLLTKFFSITISHLNESFIEELRETVNGDETYFRSLSLSILKLIYPNECFLLE